MGSNLYATLGVPRSASQDAVKKAYKDLARKFHPDRNPSPEAAERFKDITAAYDTLGDAEKRKLYDEFGEDAAKVGFDPEKARAYKRWQESAAHGARACTRGHAVKLPASRRRGAGAAGGPGGGAVLRTGSDRGGLPWRPQPGHALRRFYGPAAVGR